MFQTAEQIAAELFSENPNALHIEMSRWIITQAQVTEPSMYREVVREYRTLQREHYGTGTMETRQLVELS